MLYKYTPALVDPKTLEKTLIGRDVEVANIERILKSAASDQSLSHALLIGSKGIGKSHMLRIIYNALTGRTTRKAISRYSKSFVPVIFSEEEYPTSLTKLLMLVLRHLDAAGEHAVPTELLHPRSITEREKELARSYIETFRKKTGKLLLLLVDNVNDILERLTDEDQAVLRDILMTSNSMLLIGAAPTLFESIVNHSKPLYNFFEIMWLRDLTFDETTELLRTYADLESNPELARRLAESEPKLRAIHRLTGGNPRLILSLYHVIAEGDIATVESAFLSLLDELSPYFRERMRDLSPQQQEIIDTMARAEQLMTPTEIAAACQLPVNHVNSQIKRLEKLGYVKATVKKGRKAIYDITERLFSLWRQMRVEAGRQRLGFIVQLLEIWFAPDERWWLLQMALRAVAQSAQSGDAKQFGDALANIWYIKETIPAYKGQDQAFIAFVHGELETAAIILGERLRGQPDDDPSDWRLLGDVRYNMGRHRDALDAYKQATLLEPANIRGWLSLGLTLSKLGDHELALGAYREAIKLSLQDPKEWKPLVDLMIFIEHGAIGDLGPAVESLRQSLAGLSHLPAADLVFGAYAMALRLLIESGQLEVVGAALHEIFQSDDDQLSFFLRPYFSAYSFARTGDTTILDRLRSEDRMVVEDILKLMDKGKAAAEPRRPAARRRSARPSGKKLTAVPESGQDSRP